MAERNTKHPFPWVLFCILLGLFLLLLAPFDSGPLQQLDITFGVSLLAVGFTLSFTDIVVTKRKIYLALDQGPQCAVSLVREYGISPSKTFVILRKWQQNHWVSVCDPPAGHELAESNKAWYCLTMLGMKQLPTNIGLDPETNSP